MGTTSIPQQRTEHITLPQMRAMEDDAPEWVRNGIEAFNRVATQQPDVLLSALSRGGTPSSPNQIIAEAELGDPDPNRQKALEIVAAFFEQRLDTWVDYDDDTVARIQREEQKKWPSPKIRNLAVYLGRLAEIQAANQSSNVETPDNKAA
jgi:hypothetical protein